MNAIKHKKRLLKYLIKERDEICLCMEHGHIKYPPKRLADVELDINDVIRELERTTFMKGK